jgi:hypothetical protein
MTQKVVTNDEEVTGSKNFAIFGTFGRYVTNLRGTFVENVKSPILTHPTAQPCGGGGCLLCRCEDLLKGTVS